MTSCEWPRKRRLALQICATRENKRPDFAHNPGLGRTLSIHFAGWGPARLLLPAHRDGGAIIYTLLLVDLPVSSTCNDSQSTQREIDLQNPTVRLSLCHIRHHPSRDLLHHLSRDLHHPSRDLLHPSSRFPLPPPINLQLYPSSPRTLHRRPLSVLVRVAHASNSLWTRQSLWSSLLPSNPHHHHHLRQSTCRPPKLQSYNLMALLQ